MRGANDEYSDRHPSPADTGLVIEVSDATLRRDRGLKGHIYASAGIPHYWIEIPLILDGLQIAAVPTESLLPASR
ncbi:MAG: Uma2 family endonuclease [Acidobacteria bacterium]|nr:Uma2 family endonuclease [Acidobacteriota bacterium]